MLMQKHLFITGSSTVSWKDAIVQAITDSSKINSSLASVKIIEQRADITNGKITEYFVDLDLSFNSQKERSESCGKNTNK